jgi:hypothetical protein
VPASAAPLRQLCVRSTSTRTTSSRRRSRGTTSSARLTMKCPTPSKSMPRPVLEEQRQDHHRSVGFVRRLVDFNLNNPFLPATLAQPVLRIRRRTERAVTRRASPGECDAAALATGPNDPAIGDGHGRRSLNRRTTEVGPRISDFHDHRSSISRFGLRGPLTSTIDWDVSAPTAKSRTSRTSRTTRCSRASGRASLVTWSGNPLRSPNGCVPDRHLRTGRIDHAGNGATSSTRSARPGSRRPRPVPRHHLG